MDLLQLIPERVLSFPELLPAELQIPYLITAIWTAGIIPIVILPEFPLSCPCPLARARFLRAVLADVVVVFLEARNPVAPGLFRHLHGVARRFQPLLYSRAVLDDGGNADRYGESDIFAVDVHAAGFDIAANFLREFLGRLYGPVDQQDSELVALDAR